MKNTLVAEITLLNEMSMQELKEKWRVLCESEPPPYSKSFLISRLTYRLQELAYSGIPPKLEEKILSYDASAKKGHKIADRPVIGTKMIRLYQGVEHHVTVLKDGFEYNGQKFRSLSHIARTITGTRWNGLVFFGLKQDARRKNNDRKASS